MNTLIVALILLPSLAIAANVLVINPTFAHSHIRFLGNIADIIARAGHNVTVFAPEFDDKLKPFGTSEKSIHNLPAGLQYAGDFDNVHEEINNVWTTTDLAPMTPDAMKDFFDSTIGMYKVLLKDGQEVLNKLRNSKFDIAIHEYYDTGAFLLTEYIGIKRSILASAIGDVYPYTYDVTGIPHMASFVPNWFSAVDDKMTFWERIQNIQNCLTLRRISNDMEYELDELFQSYDSKLPKGRDLMMKKSSLILANANEFTQTARPMTPMIQLAGGAHLYQTKPLEKNIDELLNKRKYTVLFSLGTFVKMCEAPNNIKQLIAEAFHSMKDITFLFKYEKCQNETFDFSPYDNIVVQQWFPQTDLLGDDRLSLFITHGGMNSITEGQFRGKVMLSIPIFADQVVNTMTAVRVGSTMMLDRRYITKQLLVDNIRHLLDPQNQYKNKAKFVAEVLKGKAEEFRNKISESVELHAKYGEHFDYLRLHSRELSTIVLYNIDILFAIVGVSLISLLTIIVIITKILSIFKFSTTKKSSKKID